MAQTKSQKILRYALYSLLGAGVLGCVVFIFVVRPLQIRNQKQSFDKAEASLDALATQIQDKIGKADEIKKEKSCSYASQEVGRGALGCSVVINILYRTRDVEFANNSMDLVSKIFSSKLHYYLGSFDSVGQPNLTKFTTYSGRGSSQNFSQDINLDLDRINCSVDYLYPVVPLFDKSFADLGDENLEIDLVCGGPAYKEFYPLKD